MARTMRAGLYERVSTLARGASARSVDEQNAAGQQACDRNAWTVTGRYADPGLSASRFARKERAAYERLVRDASAGLLDVIVLWESSRGGRELEEWARFLNVCRDCGVRIYVTSHDRIYDLNRSRDWRTLAEDGVSSANESNQTSDRVKRALAANAADGRPHGRVLFGYQRIYNAETGKLQAQRPHPEYAAIPREVIAAVAQGIPVTAIARDLQRRGVPTPAGGGWNAALVRRIAVNRAYVGQRQHDGQWITARWPALTDPAVWWDAQQVLERTDAARAGRTASRPGAALHLLSYFARCGVCGSRLTTARPRARAVPVAIYTCLERSCVSVREDWLDAWVSGLVCSRMDDPEFWDEIMRGSDAAVLAARADEAALARQLGEADDALAGDLMTARAHGVLERDLAPRIDAARQRAESIAVPAVLRGLSRDSADRKAAFLSRPVAVRKAIVREMLASVTLHRSQHPGRNTGFDPQRVTWEWREMPAEGEEPG